MKTKISIVSVIISLFFLSCQKVDDSAATSQAESLLKSATITATDAAIQSASIEATYEADFYAGFEQILRKLSHVKGKNGNLMAGHHVLHYVKGQSPEVSIETADAGYPITITIAYGDGVETNHCKVISGTVIIVINGERGTDGSTREITFDNCKIDNIGVDGISLEEFIGDNTTTRKISSNSEVTFTITDGATFFRKGNETSEWLAGVSTPEDRSDDKIVITGAINVENKTKNSNYSRTITEGLIKLGDCRDIVSGIVEYRQDGNVIASLNYGDGTCDNLASLSVDGTTTEIKLKAPGQGNGGNGMPGKGGNGMPGKGGRGKHKGGN
jgi:hypothetical protein